MEKTGFVRTLALVTALFMAVPTGTAVASATAPDSAVTPVPTRVGVDMSGLDGLDHISVDAGTDGPHSPAMPLLSWACVSGSRSESHTETREGGEVEVVVSHFEQGCRSSAFSHYDFGIVAWAATANGEIPTTVTLSRWERRAGGELELVQREEAKSTAAVDLTWSGEGPVQYSPPVTVSPCYAPGPLCVSVRDVQEVRRAAVVAGSVHLGGLGATATLPDGQPGWMEWGRRIRVI